MKEEIKGGYIYILTNPSFPDFVKIGYADDVEARLKQLNRSECTPFAFRLYAYYKTTNRLSDIKLHNIIDDLAPDLRAIDEYDGKKRVREFYLMTPAKAYKILSNIAAVNGLEENLVLLEQSKEAVKDEDLAERIRTKRTVLPKMDWLFEQGIIHVGDKVCVINHPEEIAEVVDDEHVLYKGEKMSFNHYGTTVTGWRTIQTYAYIKQLDSDYTLSELRHKRMLELGMITQ